MRGEPIGPFGAVRSPIANLRAFVFFFLVCSTVYLGFDFGIEGPIARTAWRALTPTSEREWGFTGEHRQMCGGSWYVVTSVEPNGPFDRAGIRPGNAILARGCTVSPEGRVFRLLNTEEESVEIRVIRDPDHWCDTHERETKVRVTKSATT